MWKKRTKWVNTRMEKVLNSHLYYDGCRFLTAKEMHEYDEKDKNKSTDIAYTRKMLGYNIDDSKTSDPIIEEMMRALTCTPPVFYNGRHIL